ncbi:MFS transporter [Paractinoplanes globisporus]|uniref:MFS transporter n=1 Tax=Paractinoplanes globisporus TaxID=113565 RepID=A0ABW6W724_9ACTN|nr:MFS transporter [Actinoplanes globisporus]
MDSSPGSAAVVADPAAALSRPETDVENPKRWRALAVTQLAAFMILLDVSIVNVALPSIERDLGASAATVQWVVSGYALTMGLVLVPAGRLGDTLGRRRMFLFALSAFVLTSALSGAAPTMGLLIAARLVQGVAGGMLLPQNSALIQELFRGAERGRAFGIMGGTVGLSTASGPVIGGLLLTAFTGHDGWRWVFYVNVPIGLVALVLAARFVPVTARRRSGAHPDLVGTLLLGGGVLSVLLPLVQADGGNLRGWSPLFGVAVVLLAAFAWWELRTVRRGREPLLDPRLRRTPGFLAGSTVGLVYFAGFTGLWLVMALFLQDGLGYSPLRSGLAVTPFACGVAVSAVVAGRLVPRAGRWLTIAGLSTVIVGVATTALILRHVDGNASAWAIAGPLLFAGLGGGLVTAPNITLTLRNVPVRTAGAAGGALQTAQRLGSAIGTAVLTVVFYRVLTATGHHYPAAVSGTLLCSCGFMALGLLVAIVELRRHGRDQRASRNLTTARTRR